MDFVYLQALVLGLIEGVTEFLPISSTGHLIVAGDLLGFTGEKEKTFSIVIQLGAILAVCWHYRARLGRLVLGLGSEPAARRFALNLAVAMVPSMVLGLLLHGLIRSVLFSPMVVAVALVVGGGIILLIESRQRAPRVAEVEAMSLRDAFLVGCAQTAALIPGTSRSGATIMGGLLVGLSRKAATEFSFFLAIPTMFAATALDLYKNWRLLGSEDLGWFAVGFAAAFLSALWAVRFLLHFIASHTFAAFAWYRIGFGLLLVAWYLLG